MKESEKQVIIEGLIECADNVAEAEKEYARAYHDLELLKANHIKLNDWEKLLGKKKPTVAEKEAHITLSVEEQQNKVNELKVERDHCRRLFEVNMLCGKL